MKDGQVDTQRWPAALSSVALVAFRNSTGACETHNLATTGCSAATAASLPSRQMGPVSPVPDINSCPDGSSAHAWVVEQFASPTANPMVV